MLGDQTMAEVSASGGAYRDCLRLTRPGLDDPARQIELALVAGTGP